MAMVNSKQLKRILDDFIKREGRMPTVRELAKAMNGESNKQSKG